MQCLEEINPKHYYQKGGEEEQWEKMGISVGWAHTAAQLRRSERKGAVVCIRVSIETKFSKT